MDATLARVSDVLAGLLNARPTRVIELILSNGRIVRFERQTKVVYDPNSLMIVFEALEYLDANRWRNPDEPEAVVKEWIPIRSIVSIREIDRLFDDLS